MGGLFWLTDEGAEVAVDSWVYWTVYGMGQSVATVSQLL